MAPPQPDTDKSLNPDQSAATSTASSLRSERSIVVNPAIRRRRRTDSNADSSCNENENKNNHEKNRDADKDDPNLKTQAGKYRVLQSMADFQDGKRFSAMENTSILRDTAEAFHNVSQRFLGNESGTRNAYGAMNTVRLRVGLYRNFPLARDILDGAAKREAALKKSGHKQMNHVRGTDGWWRSMLVIEDRAMDNYLGPWIVIVLNALLACLLTEVFGIRLPEEALNHWDTVYSLVLKTSLAFLLVFRLNRCAVRYWESRSLWGNTTHNTRNLVGLLLLYGSHSPKHRDMAIRWAASFCIACKNFLRSDHRYPCDELAGFLTRNQVARLRDSNHSPLFAASMVRHYLAKIFPVDAETPPGLAHAHTMRLIECENRVEGLVEQISGMERIRSTPLPIAYVAHLRTFLFLYCIVLPYVWVEEWGWAAVPLSAFTAFALLGIEGASSEVEIPFSRERPNHLALDAYCLVILDSLLGLVVHDANLHMQGRKRRGETLKLMASNYHHNTNYASDDSDDDDDIEEEEDETMV